MMNDATKLINEMIEEKLYRVHTSYIAKVISVSNNRATIQPLHKTKEKGFTANEYSVIQNVPICSYPLNGTIRGEGTVTVDGVSYTVPVTSIGSFSFTLDVKSGSIVLVMCCERSIDTSGNTYLPRTGSHHSIQDSVIVAVVG